MPLLVSPQIILAIGHGNPLLPTHDGSQSASLVFIKQHTDASPFLSLSHSALTAPSPTWRPTCNQAVRDVCTTHLAGWREASAVRSARPSQRGAAVCFTPSY